MGCNIERDDADAARRFAHAAAQLASEAVQAVSRLDGAVPSPGASRALTLAAEQAEELERIARQGGDMRDAYLAAATALQAAAVALSEARPRPWVHVARRPRQVLFVDFLDDEAARAHDAPA